MEVSPVIEDHPITGVVVGFLILAVLMFGAAHCEQQEKNNCIAKATSKEIAELCK